MFYHLYQSTIFSFTQLQAKIRVCLTKRRLERGHNAATEIQRVWRGFICQILLQVNMLDIITVQSIIRRHIASSRYSKSLNAASTLQRFFCCIAAKRLFFHLKTMNRAAIKIQGIARGFSIRKKISRKEKIICL